MTSSSYPGACSTTPPDPRGGVQEGFPTSPCILVLGLHGSSCWAVPQPRLFCPLDLQRTHLRLGVVNSLQSATQDILDHLGQGFSGVNMVLLPISLHSATVQVGGVGNWIPFAYGEMRRLHFCCAKAQIQIQYSFAEPVAASRQNAKTWF